MTKPNQEEYVKWYNIAREHINNDKIIPKISDNEIIKNISGENWLMFIKGTQEDRANAVNYPEPNVYLVIDDNTLEIGLTFNNTPSVDKFKNIIKGHSDVEKTELVKKLLALNNQYLTCLVRKIRKMYGPSPKHTTEYEIQTNTLNDEKFEKLILDCVKIREEGIKNKETAEFASYFEGPVVELIYIEIKQDKKSFTAVLDDIVPIYSLCLDVKSDEQYEDNLILEKIKQIDSWDWYLEEDRKGLSEILKKRFNIEIEHTKLRKYIKFIDSE